MILSRSLARIGRHLLLGAAALAALANSFIHRSVPGFVIQGGGYTWSDANGAIKVPAGPAVKNEFSSTRSNVRGTIAMAKVGGNPDSATTEWFFNLADNASNLDNQNGGFTVFGRVTAPGMAVVDRIAALQVVNGGGAFSNLPVMLLPTTGYRRENFVMIDKAAELPARESQTESDRVFNYIEALYPQYAAPASPSSATFDGYYYRYYAATNAYRGWHGRRQRAAIALLIMVLNVASSNAAAEGAGTMNVKWLSLVS
ncbi:MAG: peptidylprolyl isomerase [Aquabacterium sp.]|nr:peptidylprolyl isomerase [Aquabacterium sp.]